MFLLGREGKPHKGTYVSFFFSFLKCYLFIFETEFWFIVAQAGLKLLTLLFFLCDTMSLSVFGLLSFNRVLHSPRYTKQTMYSRIILSFSLPDSTSLVLELPTSLLIYAVRL